MNQSEVPFEATTYEALKCRESRQSDGLGQRRRFVFWRNVFSRLAGAGLP